jgi:hypothetical protein
VPVFAGARLVSRDPWLGVHGALSLCALCDALTALLLARILRRLGHPTGGLLAAWFWSLSPVSVLLTLRGLEGSVSALAVALVLDQVTGPAEPGRGSAAGGLRLGLAVGLAALARTDNGPLLVAGLAAMAAADPAARAMIRTRPLAAARFAATFALGGLLVTGPWMLWNAATFGAVVQVSALAKAHNRAIYGALPGLGGPGTWTAFLARLCAPLLHVSRYLAGEDQGRARLTLVALWLGLLSLAFATLLVRAAWRASPRLRPLVAFTLAYGAAHVALFGFVAGTYAIWYATVPVLLGTLMVGGVAGGRVARLVSGLARGAWVAALAGIALLVYANFLARMGALPRAKEREDAPVFAAIRSRFPAVRQVGGFNVGAPGYFFGGGDLRVVNLDGLVNNALYRANREGRTLAWLEGHVDLIVMDAPRTLEGSLQPGDWERLVEVYPPVPGTLFYGPRRDPSGRRGPYIIEPGDQRGYSDSKRARSADPR